MSRSRSRVPSGPFERRPAKRTGVPSRASATAVFAGPPPGWTVSGVEPSWAVAPTKASATASPMTVTGARGVRGEGEAADDVMTGSPAFFRGGRMSGRAARGLSRGSCGLSAPGSRGVRVTRTRTPRKDAGAARRLRAAPGAGPGVAGTAVRDAGRARTPSDLPGRGWPGNSRHCESGHQVCGWPHGLPGGPPGERRPEDPTRDPRRGRRPPCGDRCRTVLPRARASAPRRPAGGA